MTERSIKVDEDSARIVGDLAHFLRSTKKSVLRDAVAEYAESRRSLMPLPAGGGGTGAAGAAAGGAGADAGIESLTPMQRLALRGKELIREFARHRGTNVRVAAASDDPEAITLFAQTDLMDGWGAAVRLEAIASRLLDTQVTVISTTALELTRPETLRRVLDESQPL